MPALTSLARVASLLTLLLSGNVSATNESPKLSHYGALPTTQMLSIAPSGETLAFRRTGPDSDQLIVFSLSKNAVLKAIDIANLMPHHLYFVTDQHLVLVGSQMKRIIGYRGRHDVSTAWIINITSGEVQQLLTPGDNIYLGQTGLGRIVGISADKKYLYMPALVGDSATDQNPTLQLMQVNIAKPGRPRVRQRAQHQTAIDYFMDGNKQSIVQELYSETADIHRILVRDGSEWREIFREKTDIRTINFSALTPDRKSLVALYYNEETGRAVYNTMNLQDGSLSAGPFTQADADIESIVTDINRVAHGVVYAGLRPSYQFFDRKINQRMANIVASFPEQSVHLRDWSFDWKHLVIYVEGPNSSGDYYLFSDGEKPRFLAAARPNINAEHVHPIGIVNIKARDGLTIPTLLTIPQSRLANMKNMPAVMLPHGGPQSYDKIGFDWLAQALANQGYLVIQPQFRGSNGFGLDHLTAGHGEWGRKMQDDLIDSLENLSNRGLVDADRVCVVGSSYGGYAALASGVFSPDHYQCIAAINGVSDLSSMLAFERKTHGIFHWVVTYFENFMVPGDVTQSKLDAVSPLQQTTKFTKPVLLIHGENDDVVPIQQSEDLHRALLDANKNVSFVKLVEENHHLMNSHQRQRTLSEIIKFLHQHLGTTKAQ